MTQEKILFLLNIEKDKPIDKGTMKLIFWFDVGVSVFIILVDLLFNVFTTTVFRTMTLLGFIITIIFFAVWLKLARNPTQLHLYMAVVTAVTVAKLVLGSMVISSWEKMSFDVLHIIVTIFFVCLALSLMLKKQRILKELKTNSLKQVQKNLEKKNKGVGATIIPISVVSALGVALSRVASRTLNLGLGFILWSLASVWSFMVIGAVHNCIIEKKYKVADIFSKKCEEEDNSLIDENHK